MVKLENEQLTQVIHITETLIEATEHFSLLIKDNKLHQSIAIFSSIVEGFEAIQHTLSTFQSGYGNGREERERTEQLLLMIAKEMEQDRLLKVAEILQFSLKPQLRKLRQVLQY